MGLLRALITVSLLPICTRAHMQMSKPFPINSALNPATPEYLKDYSYTSPLLSHGSDYPCKGYQTQSTSYNTTAIYSAGSMYSMSISGSANHGGGSCQLSLSYDNGQTFKVIESMIGGCPVTTTYNFTIPSFVPSSQSVLFAWTWFNEIGNREMYMNCARVEIQAAAPGRHRRAQYKRQTSMSSLPDLFVCDVDNGCTTIEQQDVQFPDPGSSVVYGSDDGTYPPYNGTGFTGSGYRPNNTSTVAPTMSTSGPYANITTTASPIMYLNTTSSTTTIESTSTIFLTDVVTVATTILVTPTSTSVSTSPTGLFSSLIIATATATATTPILSSPTSSQLLPIFPNTTSLLSPSPTSSQSPASPSTTSSSPALSPTPSQLSTFSNIASLSTSSPTTLSTSTTAWLVLRATITTANSLSSSASASATLLTGPCTPGAFVCNTGSTFSQCVAGDGGTSFYIFMGSVAAGMECSNGQIIRQNDGPCTPSGQLLCKGEYAFYICDQGGLINMGPVAPGTACVDQ